jgi:hypothetical protein
MVSSERTAYDLRQIQNKRIARQRNVAIAEGFIHVNKGKVYYEGGVGKPNGGKRGKR